MITSKMKRRIRIELSVEQPTVWIGKEGMTPQIVDETSRQLGRREIVKVRILKSALKDEKTKSLGSRIAQQTKSTLIEVRGNTVLLYKPQKKVKPSGG